MESWASILRGVRPNAFKITLEDVRVFALSETTGLVTCVEVVEADDSKGRCVLRVIVFGWWCTYGLDMGALHTALAAAAMCAVTQAIASQASVYLPVTQYLFFCVHTRACFTIILLLPFLLFCCLCCCRTAATNVFELQQGKWVLVHHQGGPVPSGPRFR